MQAEKEFHKLTMETGCEWIVKLDALQVIEFRTLDSSAYDIKSLLRLITLNAAAN
jgi:hypothetical protein